MVALELQCRIFSLQVSGACISPEASEILYMGGD